MKILFFTETISTWNLRIFQSQIYITRTIKNDGLSLSNTSNCFFLHDFDYEGFFSLMRGKHTEKTYTW